MYNILHYIYREISPKLTINIHMIYIYICIYMITRTSQWIFNPMRYTGNKILLQKHRDLLLIRFPSIGPNYPSLAKQSKFIEKFIEDYKLMKCCCLTQPEQSRVCSYFSSASHKPLTYAKIFVVKYFNVYEVLLSEDECCYIFFTLLATSHKGLQWTKK